MSIIVKAGAQTQRELVPAENLLARCYRMIHIGTNWDPKWEKNINRVRITWELPTETKVFSEENGEQPFVIDKTYTLSFHEKANLRKDLEVWRGKKFTEKELEGFDITNLIGATCMLSIIHYEATNGNTYANIGSIAKVPKGMSIPQEFNKPVIFDYDNNFDMDFVESLPDFIKEPIKSSEEWKTKMNQLEGKKMDKKMDTAVATDEMPF